MKCKDCLYWYAKDGENLSHCQCPLDVTAPCDDGEQDYEQTETQEEE